MTASASASESASASSEASTGDPSGNPSADPQVVVIGAGFGGIGMAIQLKRAGWHDFVVLEKDADLGGTWRDNRYPGCACDVPSHLYSYSFELNPDWSRMFSPQEEIWDYMRHCVRRYALEPHLRYGVRVESLEWDDAAGTLAGDHR